MPVSSKAGSDSGRRILVTIWNENWDEQRYENVRRIYPEGIHGAIAAFLRGDSRLSVKTVVPHGGGCGLTEAILEETDVLVWWGHVTHHLIPEVVAARVQERVLSGMGFVALHSAVYSKPFQRLVGAIMNSAYRESGEKERVWMVNPAHEIARGLPCCFELSHSEVYREPTGLPMPDELVSLSWYAGGEAAISGSCYYRGQGRIFAFTPGHEDYPIYHDPNVQAVIRNGVSWACNPCRMALESGEVEAFEPLDPSTLMIVKKHRRPLPRTWEDE